MLHFAPHRGQWKLIAVTSGRSGDTRMTEPRTHTSAPILSALSERMDVGGARPWARIRSRFARRRLRRFSGSGGGGRSGRHFPVKADCSSASGCFVFFGNPGSRPALDQGCYFIELPAGCRKCIHACQSLWCLHGAHSIGHSGQHSFCQHHRANLFILDVLWARLTGQTSCPGRNAAGVRHIVLSVWFMSASILSDAIL